MPAGRRALFLRSGDRYLAWVVPTKGDVVRLDLGAAEDIDAAAAQFTSLTAHSETTLSDEDWLKAGKALRKLVVVPIEAHLGEAISTICLCPDGSLAAVPCSALPGKEAGKFLIDEYLIVQISMAQDLVPWKQEAPRGNGVVAVGNVDYRKASETSKQGATAGRGSRTNVSRRVRRRCGTERSCASVFRRRTAKKPRASASPTLSSSPTSA